MHVEHVNLINYRNYHEANISFDKGISIFTGFNAQGKTNLLEAIFLAVLGKSFRSSHDDELIQWKADESKVCVSFTNRIADHSLFFHLRRGERRENILNGQKIKNRDLVGLLNAVFFSPEDLWLVKGSPSVRRKFIDLEISQTDNCYYNNLIKYNRVIFQRNNLLKKINEGQSKRNLLDIWDEQLVILAEHIVDKRIEVVDQLSGTAKDVHFKITGGAEDFSAHYFIFGGIDRATFAQNYRERLVENREKDIRRGITEIGPHKDDILFNINDYDGKMYASQGQQRTMVLSLKLAEIEIMRQASGEYPILLLDDVMSELDEKRREKLMEAITGKIQTFITGTEETNYLKEMNPTSFLIDGGHIYQQRGH